jgi:hypothetical protein
MKQLLYSIVIIILFAPAASAQYNLGIATGNWSGIYGLYLNPANIADNRERISIDVVSLNAGVDNSLGYINSKGGLIGAINNGNTNNIFSYNNSSKFSLEAPYAQVHLPGIMVAINHKHSVALTTSIRGMNQFNNFDQSLYRTITDPTYTPNSNIDLTSNKFNYTAQVWSEIGLSYAGVVLDQDEHEIKVGATLRYLGGIGYIGLKGHNLDAHFNQGSDSLVVNNSDLEYASNLLSTKSAVLNGVSHSSILDEFFGAKDGAGVGGDIGVVYDYMPDYERDQYASKNGKKVTTDYSKNRYKLRVSASVMDIGAITYKSSINSNAEVTGNGSISGADLAKNVQTFDQFRAYAVEHGFTADTSHKNTKVYLPTTLRIGADYNIYRWFYVNGMFIGNLANRQNFGNSYYSQITVTPRFDTKLFSVGLPITYGFLSGSMKLGVGVRVSGFFVGSDDILALIASHQSGVNFYIGGFVPINRKTPKGTLVPADEKEPEPDMDHGGSPDTTDNSFTYPRKTLNNTGVETSIAQAITNDAPHYFFSASDYFYDKVKHKE